MAITIGITILMVVPVEMNTLLEMHSNKWGCTIQSIPAVAHALSAEVTRRERIANFILLTRTVRSLLIIISRLYTM